MLYFRSSSEYDDDAKKVNFALSYLRDVAQEWFEPGISGLTEEPLAWLESFPAFLNDYVTISVPTMKPEKLSANLLLSI